MFSVSVIADIKAIKQLVNHFNEHGSTLHAGFRRVGGLSHSVFD